MPQADIEELPVEGSELGEVVLRHRPSKTLVITDLVMPGIDGPGLYQALQQRRPEMTGRMIFVSTPFAS